MNILTLENVSKKFGEKLILDGINLTVPEGSIYGFIGKNGAGKTTTMKMVLGLEDLTEGSIKINGESVTFGNTKTNQWTGYLPDVPEFYGFMSAGEYLKLCGEITGIPKSELSTKVKSMLKKVGLEDSKQPIKKFSRGMKQRLGAAQALLNEPKLLICDEPTSALDPNGRREFLDLLYSLKENVTIIFSTHILNDVERICDHVGILNEGKIIADTTLTDLKKQFASSKMEVLMEAKDNVLLEDILNRLIHEGKVQTYEKANESYFVSYSGDYADLLEELYGSCKKAHIVPNLLRKIEPSLESIFLEVTR